MVILSGTLMQYSGFFANKVLCLLEIRFRGWLKLIEANGPSLELNL
jgi:hypothetical protein